MDADDPIEIIEDTDHNLGVAILEDEQLTERQRLALLIICMTKNSWLPKDVKEMLAIMDQPVLKKV